MFKARCSVTENPVPDISQLPCHLLRSNSVPLYVPVGFLKKVDSLEFPLCDLETGKQVNDDDVVVSQMRKMLLQIAKRSVDV